jgi:hypothetical protein
MALATVGAAVMPERDMLDRARNNPGMATALVRSGQLILIG